MIDYLSIHFNPSVSHSPYHRSPAVVLSYEGRQLPKEYWSPGGIVRGGIHGGEAGPQGVAMVTCVGNTKQPLPDSSASARLATHLTEVEDMVVCWSARCGCC